MENIYDYRDWINGNGDFNYGTPQIPAGSPGGGTAAEHASPAPDRADQPSGEHALPLLRLGAWKSGQQYDKNNPICIHYDFRWKISHRENIRARHVCSDTNPDLVLAPSDFWKVPFQARLESLLKDEDNFPGESYTCEETIIEISIERSRQRGLTKRCKNLEIDWQLVDDHLEGLGDLFGKGRKIVCSMEFVYREVPCDPTAAKGKKKSKSATEAQKAQRAAEAGLWTRVYEKYRCRGTHCKQGPHCWPDEQGNHHTLLSSQLEDMVSHIQKNLREGEKEEDIDVNGTELPSHILKSVLNNSRKRKADGLAGCRHCKVHVSGNGECRGVAENDDVDGDRQAKLEEYCNWGLTQVGSDRWRNALQAANQVAMEQFLELNTILQHPKVVADLMVKHRIQPGIALQFVSNIKKFLREVKGS